jgi:inhibitor of KinA sporulation pathway (predicted exonuclease)
MPNRIWTRSITPAALRMPSQPIRKHLKYLLILDFEATCGGTIQNGEREIIEFPTLLYNLRSNEVQAQFHEYVKPVRHPGLTDFCSNLTGIQQVCRSQRSWYECALTAVFRKQSILPMNFLWYGHSFRHG